MRIADLLEWQRPVLPFEFFPPKTDEGHQTLRNTLEILKDDEPDDVSVTYGAGCTTRNRTVEITKTIKRDFGIEAMAHLSVRRRTARTARARSSRRSTPPASRTCWLSAATRPAARPPGSRTRAASPTRSS